MRTSGIRPVMKGAHMKGGHPFKSGSRHSGPKPRTAKVRSAARTSIRKAQSTRYLSRGGRRVR